MLSTMLADVCRSCCLLVHCSEEPAGPAFTATPNLLQMLCVEPVDSMTPSMMDGSVMRLSTAL